MTVLSHAGRSLIAAAICAVLLAQPCRAQPRTLTVSYQPDAYNAMPLIVATQLRAWRRLGVSVTFASFPSANAQLGAAALETLDVGIIGSVAGMVGAARHGLMAIALTDDEAPSFLLLLRPERAAQTLRGLRLAAMGNSPAWLTLAGCLERAGLRIADARVSAAPVAASLAQFRARSSDGLVLGFPAAATLLESGQAQAVCSGRDTGLVMPGLIVARPGLARDQPALLARFLAGYLQGAQALREARPDALAAMQAALSEADQPVSPGALREQLALRPFLSFAEQVRAMRFAGPHSEAAAWFDRLAGALRLTTGLEALPPALAFLTDRPLRELEADPALIRFLVER